HPSALSFTCSACTAERDDRKRERNDTEPERQRKMIGYQPNSRGTQQEAAISGSGDGGDCELGRGARDLSGRAEQDRHGVGQSQPTCRKADERKARHASQQASREQESGSARTHAEYSRTAVAPHNVIAEEAAGSHRKRERGKPERRKAAARC